MTRHLAWMQARHLSRNTIQARRVALRSLACYLDGPILYASREQLYSWQAHSAARIASSTLRGYISNIREFYAWARREHLLDADPTATLRGPSAPRYLPRPLADHDVDRAMAAAPPDTRAILGLARLAGLRACEISRLDWQDIDRRGHTMRIRGKGSHERIVHVAAALQTILDELPGRRGPVIRRRDGLDGRVAPHRISHVANAHLHAIGITDTLHSLRHGAATALLEASGGDLRLVQDFLGHESPATTSIYTRVRPSRMREAVEAAAQLQLDEPA